MSETLAQIKRPGSFAAQRKVTARDLRLEVSGVGPIRFPISKAKARELCTVARPAPKRYLAAARDLPSRVLKALGRLDRPLLGLIESNVIVGGSEPRASIQRFLVSEERPVLALVSLLASAHRTYRGNELSALGLGVVHAHCVAELTRRLRRPVRAPDDWSIASPKRCSCALCLELGRFLADRSRIRFDWPLAADRRAHIHRAVTAHELPVTHVTRRFGRP